MNSRGRTSTRRAVERIARAPGYDIVQFPTAEQRDESVNVERLDAVFKQVIRPVASPRMLLKIDTQGFELEVLEGAAGCLPAIAAIDIELSLQDVYAGA